METDSFFCKLLKHLPQTLFELLELPPSQALAYRFDSVEVKKSFRIDGLYLPRRTDLPLYFVEVQYQKQANFYANLFAKVFCYLEENDPTQEWMAIALFRNRSVEPRPHGPYDDLLRSHRFKRIFLEELRLPADPPLGLGILQLVSAPATQAKELVPILLQKAEHELTRGEAGNRVVELVEELLMRRFPQLNREEVRTMFKLHDLRKTRVWQEALEEGLEKGKALERIHLIGRLSAKGMPAKEIAEWLGISVQEVRRALKSTP